MKKMNNYWKQREKLYDATLAKAQKKLGKEYVRCLNKTKKDLVALYNEIQLKTEAGTLLVSDLYKFNKYYELVNNLNENITKLGGQEIEVFNSVLTSMYEKNITILDKELAFSSAVNPEQVERAINSVWCPDGKIWSDRIWSNKSALVERVKDGVVDCIARGDSKDRLVMELQKDFGIGYAQADRLARTELSYVQNKSTLDRYKTAGIEYYEVLESKGCEECAELGGQRFRLDAAEVGVNLPPIHPNCRCTILAVLDNIE